MQLVKRVTQILMPVLAAALMAPSPALAQFSKGYKFLEAVRKRESTDVTAALNEAGGTVINTRDLTSGETAMHIVTARRDLAWMSFLLARGANPGARDVRGISPMEIAARLGFHEGAELLINAKARVDEVNSAGETPLITAVHQRDIEMVRILLKAGANPDRADNSGRTARDYAKLSSSSTALLAEIDAGAKTGAARAGNRPTYGPKL